MSPRPWFVAPHAQLEQLDDNLWCVDGEVPGKPFIRRRMHVVRLTHGTLLFHNAVPVDDVALERLRALGEPALLIVPAVSHTLDVAPFAEKLGLQVYCPAPIRHVVEKKVAVAGDYAALPADPLLTVHVLDGTRTGEAILEVRSGEGARSHLLTCDAVLNLPHTGGAAGLFMRWVVRASGGPRVGPFFRWKAVTDKAALKAHLLRIAKLPGLTALVPSHGDVLRAGAGPAVQEAANAL